MQNKFGDINKFAIEYQLKNNPYEEVGILKESWGVFRLWIDGINICKFKQENEEKDYEWNLIYIVEWLSENLEYIIGHDPFPLPICGDTISELVQESDKFESGEDDEMYLWYEARSRWVHRHDWFCNRDGSYLPSVYFQRKDDEVEVSWDNEFWKDYAIEFVSIAGNYKVDRNMFKNVVFGFLEEILKKWEDLVEGNLSSDHEKISTLYKKLKLIKP